MANYSHPDGGGGGGGGVNSAKGGECFPLKETLRIPNVCANIHVYQQDVK